MSLRGASPVFTLLVVVVAVGGAAQDAPQAVATGAASLSVTPKTLMLPSADQTFMITGAFASPSGSASQNWSCTLTGPVLLTISGTAEVTRNATAIVAVICDFPVRIDAPQMMSLRLTASSTQGAGAGGIPAAVSYDFAIVARTRTPYLWRPLTDGYVPGTFHQGWGGVLSVQANMSAVLGRNAATAASTWCANIARDPPQLVIFDTDKSDVLARLPLNCSVSDSVMGSRDDRVVTYATEPMPFLPLLFSRRTPQDTETYRIGVVEGGVVNIVGALEVRGVMNVSTSSWRMLTLKELTASTPSPTQLMSLVGNSGVNCGVSGSTEVTCDTAAEEARAAATWCYVTRPKTSGGLATLLPRAALGVLNCSRWTFFNASSLCCAQPTGRSGQPGALTVNNVRWNAAADVVITAPPAGAPLFDPHTGSGNNNTRPTPPALAGISVVACIDGTILKLVDPDDDAPTVASDAGGGAVGATVDATWVRPDAIVTVMFTVDERSNFSTTCPVRRVIGVRLDNGFALAHSVVLLPSGNERLTAAFNVTTDAASKECGVGGLPSYVRELLNSSAVTVVSMRLYAAWVTDPSLYDRFVALVVTVECFPNASDPGVARRVLLPLVHFHQPAPHIADPRGGELSWLHWLLIGVAVASCVVVGLVVVCFVRRRRGAARGHVLETRKPPWVPSVSRRGTPLVGHPWRQLWTLLAPTRSLRLTSPTTW